MRARISVAFNFKDALTPKAVAMARKNEILSLSLRRIQMMCDEGVHLVPSRDWRKHPPLPGTVRGGNYQISNTSVLRLRAERNAIAVHSRVRRGASSIDKKN